MQDSFSHIEGELNVLICISTYVHLAKSADPGQAPQLRYEVGPGYALFAFYSHEKGHFANSENRSDAIRRALDHGLHCLQTQVFPIILSIYTYDGHLVNKTDSDQAPHDATPGLCLTKQCRP